jgi:hypothetical protein
MFNASIMDMQRGTQVIGSSAEYRGIEDGIRAMQDLAQKLTGTEAKGLPVRPSTQKATSKGQKSVGAKVGTGALNLAFGLGSYLEGDWSGGLTLTGGYVVAAGLFVIEATALDWDNPAVGVPATIGMTVAGLTVAYGFIRPFIYNRNPKAVALLDNTHFDIVPTAYTGNDKFADLGVRVTYSFKF